MQHRTTAAGGFYGNLRIFYSPSLDFFWNILFWFQLLEVLFLFPSVKTATFWFKDDTILFIRCFCLVVEAWEFLQPIICKLFFGLQILRLAFHFQFSMINHGCFNSVLLSGCPGDPLQCWIPRTEPALRFGHCVCSVPSVFVYIKIFVESSVVFGQPLVVCWVFLCSVGFCLYLVFVSP